MTGLLNHNGNLLQNASFETDLAYWQAYHVTTTDNNAAEGTQAATLGPDVASLYQDVALGRFLGRPLFLSFIVYAQGQSVSPSDLTVEVLWLNVLGAVIGTGLRDFLPRNSISQFRNTFFDVTDRPPLGAAYARLKFSKNAAETPITIDLVNLVPVETKNLLNNPGFESGLEGWSSVYFDSHFTSVWEGGGAVQETTFPGILAQEVDLNPLHLRSAYLLSFAAESLTSNAVTVTVRLIWLSVMGIPIGEPGIDVTIGPALLLEQGQYLNIVQLSGPAPIGAVKARLEFTTTGDTGAVLNLDQVILTRLAKPNLLANSEFDNGLENWNGSNIGVLDNGGYVGTSYLQFFSSGAYLDQKAALPPCSAGRNFLFNFALRNNGLEGPFGNVFARVIWQDIRGNDIGLGLSLMALRGSDQPENQWQVYTGITEPAPIAAVFAKVQFTVSQGAEHSAIDLDSVIFARIF